ncbi:hypothetical protein [Phocaeicola dorei]|jgi:hypothetical protein|uniref:hypothetical protein n=2 Tax=Phocaeicola dorei TaxID=357276 RepID=UPI0011112DCB|nr:hypothetical protein [Phocaeicola dorei]
MPGGTAMILKMIISVILLYYLAVLWQYFRHDLMRSFWKTDAEEADDEPEEKTEEPYTVIGKSTYRKRQTDEPDDKQRRADNQADKTDNFAAGTPENDVEQPEETATADDDDADYSDIEVEPEEDEEEEAEEEEYIPTPEEVDEEEGLGAYYPDGNPDFATGYTFEDLKKVHRIMVTDDVNEQEKQQAREVLPAVMGSDVWDEMLDEFEGARQRVARLMNNNNV